METIVPKLHASKPEPLGLGPSLEIRAYLLEREDGNIVVYRSANLENEAEEARELGGVWRQYLNHHHEASPATERVTELFGAPLYVHAGDEPEAAKAARVDETFTERHTVGEDFEVVPIPGHTPGATAFLWDAGEHRVLFTGDSIFFSEIGWRAAVIAGVSDREEYIESLELLRSLDFDLLVPGIAAAGTPFYAKTGRDDAEERIGNIIARLENGEDG